MNEADSIYNRKPEDKCNIFKTQNQTYPHTHPLWPTIRYQKKASCKNERNNNTYWHSKKASILCQTIREASSSMQYMLSNVKLGWWEKRKNTSNVKYG